MRIELPALSQLSFPDFDVKATTCDLAGRRYVLTMAGAWLDLTGGQRIKPGVLVMERWRQLEVRVYDAAAEQWAIETAGTELRDVCEAEFESTDVVLRGFSRTGGSWTELRFQGAHAYYEPCA